MDKKLIIIILLLLVSLFSPAATALFGFDEYTDDSPQYIEETVENNLGQTCTDCNGSAWISYPNGSIQGFYLFRYNTTSTKYVKSINPALQLVNGNTTIYTIRFTANRTSGQKRNATSDRTIITIYDSFPPVDSQWDVGLILILLVIQWTFAFLAYRFYDEHIIVKYGLFAIALFFNSWLMAIGSRILAINGIVTSGFTRLFDSTGVLALIINFIFTTYIMIYLVYYIIHSVMDSAARVRERK